MRPYRTITAACLLLAASRVQAETASQIIDRHIKALGGARAIRSVSTLRLLGATSEGGEFVWQTRAPASFYLEIRQGDRRTVEAVNGTTAWRDDSTGPRTLTGREQARLRALGAYRNDHFLTDKKDKTRVRLLGTETIEGRPAHVLERVTAAGIARKVFFDAQSYLIVKEEQEPEGGTEEVFFGDYRPVDGVAEPHRIRIRRGGQTVELTVRQAAHNVQVDAVVFAFPRRDTGPLPDLAVLFQQLEDNQEKLEKAQSDYTYTRTESDIGIDAQGRVKEKSERTYEVFHLGRRPVEKLVARNGRPLPPDEAKKEQERVEKVVRDHQKRVAEGKDKKEGEKNEDEMTVSEILRFCQFVNPRREPFRGRETLVYDFEARPGARPGRRIESWLQKLVGTVWIDEAAQGILRLEGRMTDSIKMGGGLLLSLHQGSSFVFEQELVNGEVWLPTYAEVHASARFLLLKGFKLDQTQRFSDYKKFSVDTSSEIKPPKP